MFYNIDCVEGAKKYIQSSSVDLIITDPPYGIRGDSLHKHYNRNENNVLEGYIEVPKEQYYEFTLAWIREAERVLRPGGSLYVVSGYTNLIHILNALAKTDLKEINHLIWKYNFGVYTRNKYISSHYHILYYVKRGKIPTFNTYSRFSDSEKDEGNGSLNYKDREDVWIINREYKPGQVKNKNELPKALLEKLILYSSNENDLICDFFLGSFSTAKMAISLGRRAIGFELSNSAYNYQIEQVKKIKSGELLSFVRIPPQNILINKGKPVGDEEKNNIKSLFQKYRSSGLTKKDAINQITNKTGRGYWSVLRIVDGTTNKSSDDQVNLSLFPPEK